MGRRTAVSPSLGGGAREQAGCLQGTDRALAFLKLDFAAGEAAQVDWGEYGTIAVGSTRRRLSFFLMVLCYSRRMYLEFTLSRASSEGSMAWGGGGGGEGLGVDLQPPGRSGSKLWACAQWVNKSRSSGGNSSTKSMLMG